MSQRYIGGLIYNPPGGFSGYFDGSGDYLQTASNAAFGVGSGDFTIELWVFLTANFDGTGQGLITASYNTNFAVIGVNGGGGNRVDFYVANTLLGTGTNYISLNTWTHVACVRASGTTKIYFNGNEVATSGSLTGTGAAAAVFIGTLSHATGQTMTGYISNARIVKGTAVYTAAFTPPNGPLQAITNTSLLTCAYPTFRDGSSNNFTITVNGNTAVSTQNPFPQTQLPNPALGNQGNGVYSMSQYQALRSQNLWPAFDQYWPYVTLMLHGNGTNGAQNNTFLDSSTNNFTITRNGNTTQGTFTPYGSNWSNFFTAASSQALTITTNTNIQISGAQDFTIEAWVWANSFPNGSYNIWIAMNSTNYFSLTSGGIKWAGDTTERTFTCSPALNTWNHVTVSRSGGSLRCFLNGTQVGSTIADSQSVFTQQTNLFIAANQNASQYFWDGYVSNVRVVKGTALYTTTFTPSTTPLTAVSGTQLLTCQSNRFIDNSTNAFSLTVTGSPSVQRFSPFAPTTPYAAGTIGGSGYFDGSGDYLTAPDNAALEPGSSDLTWEMWINTTNSTQYTTLYSRTPGSFTTGMWSLMMNTASSTSGDISVWFADYSAGGPLLQTTSVSVRDGAWHHIAVVRNGSAWTIYIDGVSRATATWSGSVTDIAGGPYIGADQYYGRNYLGYMVDVRIVKGTAVYTSNFTPNTAPLTAITNTSLLLNYTNGGIIDNAMMNDLETVGNAQISTSVSKFGGGSILLNAASTYMTMRSSPNFAFGTGDFTLEMWAYFTSVANFPTLTDSRANSSSTAGFNLGLSSAKVQLYTTSQLAIGATTLSANTWYHIAVCRAGSTLRIFVNGVQDASVTNSTNWSDQTLIIGATPDLVNLMTGNIDDLRITKGYARYTANFTPQRSQWQDQ